MQVLSQYTDIIFDQLRLKQDVLADHAVQALVSNPHFAEEINSWESKTGIQREMEFGRLAIGCNLS